MTFDTIPNAARVSMVEYTPKYDKGVLEISYCPTDKLIEFISFEAWLKTLEGQAKTVEDFARLVFDEIFAALGGEEDLLLEVVVRQAQEDTHAPATVTVSSQQ